MLLTRIYYELRSTKQSTWKFVFFGLDSLLKNKTTVITSGQLHHLFILIRVSFCYLNQWLAPPIQHTFTTHLLECIKQHEQCVNEWSERSLDCSISLMCCALRLQCIYQWHGSFIYHCHSNDLWRLHFKKQIYEWQSVGISIIYPEINYYICKYL